VIEKEQSPIYRYMHKDHISNFFKTGELRIPSFKQCRINENNARQDDKDGIYQDTDAEGLGLFVDKKIDTYVLSCSFEKSKKLKNCFGVDGYFEITEPIEFFKTLCCKMNIKNPDERDMGAVHYCDNPYDLEKSVHFALIKRKKFAYQKEFRFIFRISAENLYYEICCPEAIKFCRRLT